MCRYPVCLLTPSDKKVTVPNVSLGEPKNLAKTKFPKDFLITQCKLFTLDYKEVLKSVSRELVRDSGNSVKKTDIFFKSLRLLGRSAAITLKTSPIERARNFTSKLYLKKSQLRQKKMTSKNGEFSPIFFLVFYLKMKKHLKIIFFTF